MCAGALEDSDLCLQLRRTSVHSAARHLEVEGSYPPPVPQRPGYLVVTGLLFSGRPNGRKCLI